MSTESPRPTVFISYNHKDAAWAQRVRIHLDPLAREYGIHVWDYKLIRPGENWRQETERSINSARVAVLLVTADFLASEFIANDELPRLLKAAERKGTKILPIIVSPSSFSDTSLARYQTANDPREPLSSLSFAQQEAIFVKVQSEVKRYVIESSEVDLAPADWRARLRSFKSGIVAVLLIVLVSLIAIFKVGMPGSNGAPQSATATPQTGAQAKSELSGTVLDLNDKPLQGARVTLDDLPAMSPVETSSDGVFNLRDIPKEYGDGVRVRVVMEGYHPNPYTEDVVIGKAPPRIRLTKAR